MTVPARSAEGPLLDVRDLVVHFDARAAMFRRGRQTARAVDGVSFSVDAGETLGLVGESGCGKSTTGRALLKLVKPTAGSVSFQGEDLLATRGRDLKRLRRGLQAVFQDPYDSLNPRMRIRDIVGEPLIIHGLATGATRRRQILELMERVGLSEDLANRLPAELSGGQRQRVGIARALAVNPSFIVCDEAVSALDVSVQAQVLNLLRRLQQDLGLSYLFISHDLSVVRHVSDRVAVMYAGKLAESASSEVLYARPYHPYTLSILAAAPVADPDVERRRPDEPVTGEAPSPVHPPSGCRFHPRCPLAQDRCRTEEPELVEVEPGRWTACHFWRTLKDGGGTTPASAPRAPVKVS
ncbi:MAG: ATP-binding cassette domain-containing protein [Propionibacteriales bacterium]|nr:ATP-binding cassette domain-containing protein [Propionibacteriales bacterium]